MALVAHADELRRLADSTQNLSVADHYNLMRRADQIAAENKRKGTALLAKMDEHNAAENEAILAEIQELDESFIEVAQLAGRPDIDPRELSRVEDELDRRARVVRKRKESFTVRVAEHDEKAKDPEGYFAAHLAKWAGMSPQYGPQTFLHRVDGI